MVWEFAPTFDAGHRAVLEALKPIVYVCPPAGWMLSPLFDQLSGEGEGTRTLVVVPDAAAVLDVAQGLGWLASLRPLHAATGLARTERLLRANVPRALVATPQNIVELSSRAALKAAALQHVAILWPEHFAAESLSLVDTILSEARSAQRLVVTSDDVTVSDFIERYARRAPVAVCSRPPSATQGGVRYALVDAAGRGAALHRLLDHLNPDSALIVDPLPMRAGRWAELARDPVVRVSTDIGDERVALCILADLPTAEMLSVARGIAGDVVVVVRPAQIAYLRRIASPLKPLTLSPETDAARDRTFQLRRQIRDRARSGDLDGEMLKLAPLFDEFDAATLAAAALAGTQHVPAEAVPEVAGPAADAWVRIHVSVGKKDNVRPNDLVGALLNGVGLAKNEVGRVDIRDRFALVEVAASQATRCLNGLNGMTLRGKRAMARLDRGR